VTAVTTLEHRGSGTTEAPLDAYSRVVADVARRLAPTVASLRVTAAGRGGRQPVGAGSGVVVTPDGFVLTSAHVVARADGGTATLADGRELEFSVVGADPLSDLAVIRVGVAADGPSLVPAVLGDAAHLVVGQLVVAVGNPLGFAGSVSAGVVSGLGRSMATSAGNASRLIDNVIQTDAALHPGNSGGALAVHTGEVVGINTAVVGPWVGQGLGLAVPINEATRQIISALMREGRVRRAYLGIAGGSRALPPNVARTVGREKGIGVSSVVVGSPAGTAGLRPDDVIVEIDGVIVDDVALLQRLMTGDRVGRPLTVSLVRDGRLITVEVHPAELD
jgi:S1-C subfamily serine protease